MTIERISAPQTLLIDADDTLWENNIYFERAIASFISYLDHKEHSPAEVREALNQVERECIVKHGYGLHSFHHALVGTFERLSPEPISDSARKAIRGFADMIAEQPIEMFPEVPQTLEYLSGRHHVIMVTKGDIAEQAGKVERSGLKPFFREIEIVAEKNAATYRELAHKHGFDATNTWMVGNSPKSDINPALEAGLNAVFVPHEMTWVLEQCELGQCGDGRTLLTVRSFADLRNHF